MKWTRNLAVAAVTIVALGAMREGKQCPVTGARGPSGILAAEALPSFARKYNMPCQACHSVVPRLTPLGYRFLRSGFRFSKGEEPTSSLSAAATFMSEFHAQSTHPDGNSGFDVEGVEGQAASALGDNLSTMMMFNFPSDGSAEFEQTWLQYNSAPTGSFWTARAGQFPVLSGFKLIADRNIAVTEPMMYGNVGPIGGELGSGVSALRARRDVTGTPPGNFSIGALQRGVEFGYSTPAITGRVSWLNGVNEAGEGNVPLQGHRGNDVVVQGDYLIGDLGSSVSAFYYHGKTPFTTAGYDNKFWRSGVFGSYTQALKGRVPELTLDLNAGLLLGQDTVNATGDKAKTRGTVLEMDLIHKNTTALVLRYDTLKASDQPGSMFNVTTKAYTFDVAQLPSPYVRWAVEYRKQRQPGADSLIGSLWFFY